MIKKAPKKTPRFGFLKHLRAFFIQCSEYLSRIRFALTFFFITAYCRASLKKSHAEDIVALERQTAVWDSFVTYVMVPYKLKSTMTCSKTIDFPLRLEEKMKFLRSVVTGVNERGDCT